MNYPNVQLYIDGKWRPAASGKTIPVLNPATEERVGTVAHAEKADLDEALAAAEKGFKVWREISAYERSKMMRKAADLMRERADEIATIMTIEQGKVLAEAKIETHGGADIIEWFAEEGRRTYGRLIPARAARRLPDGDQGAGRSGRRLHAVEFPDQPGREQAERRAGRGLLDHRQGAGRDARPRPPN